MARYSNKLQYEIVGDNYPVLVMDDFYSNQQVKEIWHELDGYNFHLREFLWEKNLNDPNRTKDEDGNSLATNSRIYLDRLYAPNVRYMSFILAHYGKLMSRPVLDAYKEMHPSTRNVENVNKDYSMISYYTGGDKYEFHKDNATHTALWWTYKEPKAFKGGDLVLKDGDFTIECKHNRMVMFPSYYLHASTPLEMDYANDEEKLGKYTISHFFNINV